MLGRGCILLNKTAWFAKKNIQYEAAGMVVRNSWATSSSVVTAVPKGSEVWIVADCRTVSQLLEQAAMPMLRLEELGLMLEAADTFYMLDIIQGYW